MTTSQAKGLQIHLLPFISMFNLPLSLLEIAVALQLKLHHWEKTQKPHIIRQSNRILGIVNQDWHETIHNRNNIHIEKSVGDLFKGDSISLNHCSDNSPIPKVMMTLTAVVTTWKPTLFLHQVFSVFWAPVACKRMKRWMRETFSQRWMAESMLK